MVIFLHLVLQLTSVKLNPIGSQNLIEFLKKGDKTAQAMLMHVPPDVCCDFRKVRG